MIKVTVWDPRFGIAAAPVPPAAFVFPRVLAICTPHCKRENGLIDDLSGSEARLRERKREKEREMRQPNMAWRIPASRSEPAEVKLRRPEPWIDRIV